MGEEVVVDLSLPQAEQSLLMCLSIARGLPDLYSGFPA